MKIFRRRRTSIIIYTIYLVCIFLFASQLPVSANEPPLSISAPLSVPMDDDDDDDDDYFVDQIVIKLDLTQDVTIEEINDEYETTTLSTLSASHGIYLLQTDDDDSELLDEDLKEDSRIEWAEANYTGDVPEANPRISYAWGGIDQTPLLTQYAGNLLKLPYAHLVTQGEGIVVAVLDTGIEPNHPYFDGKLIAGYDFVDDDDDPTDVASNLDNDGDGLFDESVGHGTHVAGIVHYVAPEAQIMPIRVLDSEGSGNVYLISEAIRYAIENGADVINLSFGTTFPSSHLRAVVKEAKNAGVIIVAAAGNNGSIKKQYPAAYRYSIAVTSIDAYSVKAPSANYGAWVDIAAPGEGIYSAYPPNGYAWWSGTSMATPFIAGEAALILSFAAQQRATIDVSSVIEAATVSIESENPSYQGLLGVGRPDIASAVGFSAVPTAVDLHAAETNQASISFMSIGILILLMLTILVMRIEHRLL